MNGDGMHHAPPSPGASNTTHAHRGTHRVRFPDVEISSEFYPSRQHHGMGPVDDHAEFFHDSGSRNDSILDILLSVVVFGATLVCVGGLVAQLVVLYLTVRPFSLNVYRRLSAHMGTSTFLDAMALLIPNTRLVVTGDSDIPTPVGASVLVCNHLQDGDWWALLMLGRCVGFQGTMKAFLRNEYLQINLDDVDQSNIQNSSPTAAASSIQTGNRNSSNQLRPFSSSGNQNMNTISTANPGSSNASVTGGLITTMSTPSLLQQHHSTKHKSIPPPSDLTLAAKLLHLFLEFPLLNSEDSGSPDREKMFTMLRSLAADNAAATAPVHLIFFPEGWSIYRNPNGSVNNGASTSATVAADRRAILAKSNEFAKREGKPQLKCLLLPRTRIFNTSLECLRESNPFVYDLTLAYTGYNGSLPTSIQPLSLTTLFFTVLRRKFPKEVHIRIKRYSMEEVLHIDNVNWLTKKWAEKDRLLCHFARHQQFPTDSRGYYGRPRVFNTRYHSVESSIGSLIHLVMVTSAVPILVIISVPLSWTVLWIWVVTKALQIVYEFISGNDYHSGSGLDGSSNGRHTPGSVPSAAGTPFFPATPFASPNIFDWSRSRFSSGDNKNGNAMHNS